MYLISFVVEKASKGAGKAAKQGGSSAKARKAPFRKREKEEGDEEFVPVHEKRANAGKMPRKYKD